IKRLGEYLLSNPAFAGKTFIIPNWEGDNALDALSNRRSVWDYYTQWIRARAEGVRLARRNYPSSAARLFSGLEFNAIKSLNSRKKTFCGTPVADPINERTRHGECNAANHLSEVFDAFDGAGAFQVSYVIFWQIIDNRRIYAAVDERFGLFR